MQDESLSDLNATVDQLLSASEIYHENSKLHISDKAIYTTIGTVNTSPEIRRVITRPFSNYRGYPSVPLPRDFPPSDSTLEKLLHERRSVRQFSGAPLSLEVLAKTLYLGDGIVANVPMGDGTEWHLRTAPSGGGLFPIDLYCFALRVDGLTPGLYFYNVLEHSLECLAEADFTETLQEATSLKDSVGTAGACIVMAGFMHRAKFKYGERAYRFALLEAGHIAQNLLLAAGAAGMGSVAVGGFLDDQINAALRLDGCEEIALYLVLIGQMPDKQSA